MSSLPVNPGTTEVLSRVTRWPSVEAKAWVVGQTKQLCRLQSIRAVVLFGSIVRPVTKSSDVDLLIIYAGERPKFFAPPVDVDIRVYDEAHVESLLESGHDLLGWALRLGFILCERDFFWSKLVETHLRRLKLPSAEVADERAVKAGRLLNELRNIGDTDAVAEQTVALLTHLARAKLIRAGVFPTSRPELVLQLEKIGVHELAQQLQEALSIRDALMTQV